MAESETLRLAAFLPVSEKVHFAPGGPLTITGSDAVIEAVPPSVLGIGRTMTASPAPERSATLIVDGGREFAGNAVEIWSLVFGFGSITHVAPGGHAGIVVGMVVQVAPGGQPVVSNLHESSPLGHGFVL